MARTAQALCVYAVNWNYARAAVRRKLGNKRVRPKKRVKFWFCLICGYYNFLKRDACMSCGKTK